MRKDNIPEEASFDEVEDVASFRECTGLFPALPLNDPAADDDLARLYAIHAPKKRDGVPREDLGEEQRM